MQTRRRPGTRTARATRLGPGSASGPTTIEPPRSSALNAPRDGQPVKVVVLASGTGSLLQSLIDASAGHSYRVVAVGTDRPCAAVDRAADAGIASFTVCLPEYASRLEWDSALTKAVAAHEPGLVVSAGFMKVLGPAFLARFGGRTLNTHPALLPSFPGAHAVPDALAHGAKVSGSTVHLVDAGVDTGPILAQEAVPVLDGDDAASLHERIKVVERRLLVDVVSAVAGRGIIIDGRKARIP